MKRCFALVAASLLMSGPAWAKGGLEDWAGTWNAGSEQSITIAVDGDALQIDGDATFGGEDEDSAAMGAVNTGSFSALVPASWIKDGTVSFGAGDDGAMQAEDADDSDCIVTLTRKGEKLEASDNMNCGGLNVTFTGDYVRE